MSSASSLATSISRWSGHGRRSTSSSYFSLTTLLLCLGLIVHITSAHSIFDRRRSHLASHLLLDEHELEPRTLVTAGSGSSGSFPKPFDATAMSNFTESSCQAYFEGMLANQQFQACRPVSLLLQTSQRYFQATKSIVSITQVLDQACNVPWSSCSALMSNYASNILSPSNCQTDYNNMNPIVQQALSGLLAYEPVYRATCLRSDGSSPSATNARRDPSASASSTTASSTGTGSSANGGYCYAAAITNATNPSGSYMYFLPLGVPLPASSMPTCNTCVKSTMQLFATYAVNATQPLSKTYTTAAQTVDMYCGPKFVDDHVNVGTSAATLARGSVSWIGAVAVAAVLAAVLSC